MRNITALLLVSFLLITSFSACGKKTDEYDEIWGEWQEYGIKREDEIVAFEELGGKEFADQFSNRTLIFKENNKMVLKLESIEMHGVYEKQDDSYVMSIAFYDSVDQAELIGHFESEYLVLEQILPEGYEDYDIGEPIVYKRTEF